MGYMVHIGYKDKKGREIDRNKRKEDGENGKQMEKKSLRENRIE